MRASVDREAVPGQETLADADPQGRGPQIIPERDCPRDSDTSDVTAKQNGRRSRHKPKVKGQLQSDIPANKHKKPSKTRGSKVKPPAHSEALSDDQMTFTEVSDLEDVPRPEVAPGAKRSKPSSSAASGRARDGIACPDDHPPQPPPPRPLRHTLPSPQHASSPVRPLSSTIGEVVGAHLFVSSLDTTDDGQCAQGPTGGSTSQAAASAEPRFEQKAGHADLDDLRFNDDDAVHLSDEDEFPEDEILRDLRQRRASHLERLLAIDRLLGGAADSTAT